MPSWENDAAALHAKGARHVLFLGDRSDARVQIAEAIARALAPRQVRVSGAGAVRGDPDPLAVRALAELSVSVPDRRPRTLDDVDPSDVDAVVVLSDGDPTPAALRDALRVRWPLPDPAAPGGGEEERLARYRAVRNELRTRLMRVFAREPRADDRAGKLATIEPAAGGDLEAIQALLAASLLPSRDVGRQNQRFIVAREEGAVIGCAGLEAYGGDAQLRSFAVDWTRRNAGLGTRLHQRLLHEALLGGVDTLWAITLTAEGFLARHGYRRVPLDAVPPAVRGSEEFRTLSPASAATMSRPVGPA